MERKQYTVIEDYPKHLQEWLKRADVQLAYDEESNRLYITSMNTDSPLTNQEKFMISRYLVMYKHAFRRLSYRDKEETNVR